LLEPCCHTFPDRDRAVIHVAAETGALHDGNGALWLGPPKNQARALLRSIDPMLAIVGNRRDASQAAKAIVDLHRYVERVVDRREAEPGPTRSPRC
jgi:hypothetical protein